jgi:hypothetical protein
MRLGVSVWILGLVAPVCCAFAAAQVSLANQNARAGNCRPSPDHAGCSKPRPIFFRKFAVK